MYSVTIIVCTTLVIFCLPLESGRFSIENSLLDSIVYILELLVYYYDYIVITLIFIFLFTVYVFALNSSFISKNIVYSDVLSIILTILPVITLFSVSFPLDYFIHIIGDLVRLLDSGSSNLLIIHDISDLVVCMNPGDCPPADGPYSAPPYF
jgi:heme/copper-type cytochrome/quinol oxidase subunit 2